MFNKLKGKFEGDEDPSSSSKPPPYAASSSATSSKTPDQPPLKAFDFPPDKKPGFSTSFASVSLHQSDRIRIMQFPLPVCAAVRTAILHSWPAGIQSEREYYGSLEFKLSGTPWRPSGAPAIHARRLTRAVMATLFSHGWVLYITTDLSRKNTDKDSLFFRLQDPAPAPREWMSCTFSKIDRWRLIDAPPGLLEAMLAELRPSVQSHSPYHVPGVHEIKLRGSPFLAEGGETMTSRRLALQMFTVFERHGFSVYASIDQKFKGDGREVDSWHLSRALDWTPGAPVYHQ